MAVYFDNATCLAGLRGSSQYHVSQYLAGSATAEYWRGLFNPGHNGTSKWMQLRLSSGSFDGIVFRVSREDTVDDATASISVEMRSLCSPATAWTNYCTTSIQFSGSATLLLASSMPSQIFETRFTTASLACPIELRITMYASVSTLSLCVPASGVEIRVVGEFAS